MTSLDLSTAETAGEPPAGSPALEARGVGKRYPGVVALDSVSISLHAGQIHALLGENGAGKSTLIAILSGLTGSDGGELFVDGSPGRFANTRAAQDLGISTIYQEQTLAPDLTVVQNVFFGRELRRGLILDEKAMHQRVLALSEEFGLTTAEIARPVAELGALKQHAVQILKALAFDARVVILDEPTSGLEDSERQTLFDHMRRLRDRGVALLWVTHRLDELFGLADSITVLRDSRWVATVDPADHTPESLVRLMVGRERRPDDFVGEADAREPIVLGRTLLKLDGVTRFPLVRDVSFEVAAGEILGIAGIAGAGRTEVARVILGADKADTGTIEIADRVVQVRNPGHARALGIAYVPEERKVQSILGTMSIAQNITISNLPKVTTARVVLNRRRERAVAREYVDELGIRTSGVGQAIGTLSGGNQQKAIVARCLFSNPSVVIFDEPTQGVDVAAKAEIYRLVNDFVAAGGAAIVISSELPELLALSDRILVMREGRKVGEVVGFRQNPGRAASEESATAEKVMAMAARSADSEFGVGPEGEAESVVSDHVHAGRQG